MKTLLVGTALLTVGLASCLDREPRCVFPEPGPPPSLRLAVVGSRLLDFQGREVVLRGVNTGGRSKFYPFFPFPFAESGLPAQAGAPDFESAALAYFERVREWGLNVVRLPFSWEALEPARGSYDERYLERYRRLAEICQGLGLRVIVDFHQDAFAWPYCGDGFPGWACARPLPTPPADCSGWFTGYLSSDSPVAAAFDRFWSNVEGLRDRFREMWRHVARRLWSVDAVIGFEIMNEPFRGSAEETFWGQEILPPFYEEIARAIREVAPGAPVFFDASGTAGAVAQTTMRPPRGEGFVFAPHYYAPSAFFPGVGHDPAEIARALGRWAARGSEWGVPVLVGEFGIRPEHPGADVYLRAHYDAFDQHLLHAALWEYSTTADDWNHEGMSITGPGGVERAVVAEVVRAYPRAVAGAIQAFRFDATTRSATLSYQAAAGGLTEIATPLRLYPRGVAVELAGVRACTRQSDGTLFVVATEEGPLAVEIRPR